MSQCFSERGSDGYNPSTCAGEIMLFGVRVKVDPMRKSVSMNNLSQYEQPQECSAVADVAAAGYASADEAVHHQSSGNRERKRGVPWTEEEHKLFLLGLQKVGKGDWRGISRNFVKTRSPTQVASHAQKYFLRRSNLNRRRRRSSLFDITTDSITAISMEEDKVYQESGAQPLLPPNQPPPSPETSSFSGSKALPFPVTIGPVSLPVQIEYPLGKLTLGQIGHLNHESAKLVCPIPVLQIPIATATPDHNLNQKKSPLVSSPLSLKLSLSSDQNQLPRRSANQVISNFNNGDNIISVA